MGYSWYNAYSNISDVLTNKDTDTLSGNYSDTRTQTVIPDTVSSNSTILPTPPVDIGIILNPDIVNTTAAVVENTRASEYFAHITWVQQSVSEMMARADLINNLF